jgi:hypothetical protein
MATIRGNDGSITVGGNSVVKISSFEITAERQLLEDTGMSDSGRTYKSGFLNWTSRVVCRFDPADTTGQQAILDEVLAASPSNLAFVFTAVAAGANYSGSGLPIRFNHRQEIDGIVEIEFEVQGIGALTYAVS